MNRDWQEVRRLMINWLVDNDIPLDKLQASVAKAHAAAEKRKARSAKYHREKPDDKLRAYFFATTHPHLNDPRWPEIQELERQAHLKLGKPIRGKGEKFKRGVKAIRMIIQRAHPEKGGDAGLLILAKKRLDDFRRNRI